MSEAKEKSGTANASEDKVAVTAVCLLFPGQIAGEYCTGQGITYS